MFAYFFFIVECDLTIMICLILPYKKYIFRQYKTILPYLELDSVQPAARPLDPRGGGGTGAGGPRSCQPTTREPDLQR